MVPVLALLFLATPLIEIAVFIQVGGFIGLWPTLGLVVLTAVVGVTLLRHQGLRTITRARSRIERNEAPVEEIFDGLCLAVAAVCLLTPGFFTDAVGVALLIPGVRSLLRTYALARMIVHMHQGPGPHGPGPNGPGSPHRGGAGRPGDSVIEGEYTDVTSDRSGNGDRGHQDGGGRQLPH